MDILYHHRTRGKGAEGVHIMGVADGFRHLGNTVEILAFPGVDTGEADATATSNEPAKKSVWSRLAQITKYVPEFLFELMELAYNLVVYRRLGSMLKQKSWGMVYERYSLFMFFGVWLAKKRGVPIVLEINDSALVERVRPLFFRRLAVRIERWCFSNANGLVFISNYFKDLAESEYGAIAPAIVCPNAADISLFKPDTSSRQVIRSKYGLEDKLVCGYVGAFVYWHGIDWFVKEVVPTIQQYPNLAFLLVGDGVAYEEVKSIVTENKLQDQIILTGRVPHKEVSAYVSAMDFGILPDSNEYGSPMKLFEMMAMGVASVCPAFGPINEVVQENQTGWLFTPKNKKEAVERVLSLASNAENVKKVGDNARDYITSERQWFHNSQAALDLLK